MLDPRPLASVLAPRGPPGEEAAASAPVCSWPCSWSCASPPGWVLVTCGFCKGSVRLKPAVARVQVELQGQGKERTVEL